MVSQWWRKHALGFRNPPDIVSIWKAVRFTCCRGTVLLCRLQEMAFGGHLDPHLSFLVGITSGFNVSLPAVGTLWSVSRWSSSLFKVLGATKSSRKTGCKQTRADTDRFSDNLPLWLLMFPLSRVSFRGQMLSFLCVSYVIIIMSRHCSCLGRTLNKGEVTLNMCSTSLLPSSSL